MLDNTHSRDSTDRC